MSNPILDEIYRYRDEHAKKFSYDTDAIIDDDNRNAISAGVPLVSRKDVGIRAQRPKLPPKSPTKPMTTRTQPTNPILEEVYRARDQIAKECNYDVDAIFDHAERAAKELGIKTVSRRDLEKRNKQPKKILAKQHARPTKSKKRTKATKH